MIEYFKYDISSCNYVAYSNMDLITERINSYAKEYDLKIIGATTDRDRGIFVIFEPANETN